MEEKPGFSLALFFATLWNDSNKRKILLVTLISVVLLVAIVLLVVLGGNGAKSDGQSFGNKQQSAENGSGTIAEPADEEEIEEETTQKSGLNVGDDNGGAETTPGYGALHRP